ncbi:hypothetical protein NM208_g7344 [Fusarium decemcellulare]|uniref:Uncharacterized protein n=1 Tax=Fusarium decemcellulare TaxID=57161 RepID=A0ACC1S9J0_9HYPO|nr:hypothetical protein NM208_g7344 [Fusarium decemcellulare]
MVSMIESESLYAAESQPRFDNPQLDQVPRALVKSSLVTEPYLLHCCWPRACRVWIRGIAAGRVAMEAMRTPGFDVSTGYETVDPLAPAEDVELLPLRNNDSLEDGHSYRYATIAHLSKYIPELDPEHPRARTMRVEMAKRSTMLRTQLILALLVVIINLGFTAWAVTTSPHNSDGVGLLLSGNCRYVANVNSALHVGLNVLSSLFLGAGNYCMQVLVSPSREELDKAHRKGVSLEIGVPSIKNLRHIQPRRVILWLATGLVSVLLHLLDCVERYIDPLKSTSAVVVVTRNVTTAQNDNSSLVDGWFSTWDSWSDSAGWMCSAYQDGDLSKWRFCGQIWADTFADNWVLGWPKDMGVDYCLVGEEGDNQARCELHYSAYISIIVCICTLLGASMLLWTWLDHLRKDNRGYTKSSKTLVTMGDAIDSFLDVLGPSDAVQASGITTRKFTENHVALWKPVARIAWFKASSNLLWGISLTLYAAGFAVPLYFTVTSLEHLGRVGGMDVSAAGLWKQGFKIHPATLSRDDSILDSNNGASALINTVILVNSPQLLISFLYLFYNNSLTRQLVADEWTRFLRPDGKKPLRVSSPVGMQRSSYFLSLPLKYSIPLTGLLMLLHWLISQSIFLVRAAVFGPGPDGQRLPVYDRSTRGYSPLATILAVALAFVLVAAMVVNSAVRKYHDVPQDFPAMAYDSSAISALCQRPERDVDARLFPLSIGVVKDQQYTEALTADGRVTFSTDTTLTGPVAGARYLQPLKSAVVPGRQPKMPSTTQFWKRVRNTFTNSYTRV